jgi:hypothetical protein
MKMKMYDTFLLVQQAFDVFYVFVEFFADHYQLNVAILKLK